MRAILLGTAVLLTASAEARVNDICFKVEDAAYQGKNAEIEALIAKGAQVNCQFPDGWTALMHAVYAKKTDTVQFLLTKGADPNQKRNDGVTALAMAKAHLVLAMGDEGTAQAKAVVKLLVDAGVN